MSRIRRTSKAASTLAIAWALLCPASDGLAQPARPGPPPRPAPIPPPRPLPKPPDRPRASAPKAPTEEQINKRLDRVERRSAERQAKREQRRRDRRKALRKRLRRQLHGNPITPAIRAGLEVHARRIAQLRRIREVAAKLRKYETVLRVDKLIRREDARHDRWLRALQPSTTADADPPAATAEPASTLSKPVPAEPGSHEE